MIAGMTYYQILWYFLIYSMIGWIMEVMFHAVVVGKVINRGFLNGPLCPVYGFGMLTVLAVSNTAQEYGVINISASAPEPKTLLLLFAGGMALATLVELIAGWLLDVCFHMRWWDYSDKPFNFHGYICLEFSIIWGLGITAAVYLVHPMMVAAGSGIGIGLSALPQSWGWVLLGLFYSLFLADLIVTVAIVIGLNRRLKELDQIRASMRVVSDRMTDTIASQTIRTSQRIEEGQVQMALATAELKDAVSEKTNEAREALMAGKDLIAGRATAGKDLIAGKATAGKDLIAGKATAGKDLIAGKASAGKDAMERRAGELKREIIARSKHVLRRLPRQTQKDSRPELTELLEHIHQE